MHKSLKIVGALIGVLVLVIAAVFGYAVLNLNSIIAAQRGRILASASDALGREVDVGSITASLGWGVAIDLKEVKISDDPAFSPEPFVQADNVYLKVDLIPLLAKHLHVSELILAQPEVRIIRDRAGALNVGTIGKKGSSSAQPGVAAAPQPRPIAPPANAAPESPVQAAPPSGAGGAAKKLNALAVNAFTIDQGTVVYQDLAAGGAPLKVRNVNLKVRNFRFDRPFAVTLALAALGDRQNLTVSGTAGPLMRDGRIDAKSAALNLKARLGPLAFAQLRTIPQAAKALPPALKITGPIGATATIGGTAGAPRIDARADLTANEIAFPPKFDKPAGVALKAAIDGGLQDGHVQIAMANLTLADLQAKLSEIAVKPGAISARVDSNRFDLAPLARLAPAAAKYNPRGAAEIHSAVAYANGQPSLDGAVLLSGVNVNLPGGKAPPVGNLGGMIKFAGQGATVGPLNFTVGSAGHGRLLAVAKTLQPLDTTYQLNVDQLNIAELIPSRAKFGAEQVAGLAAEGAVRMAGGAPRGTVRASAASGMVANVNFSKFAIDAAYADKRATINSLKLNAFSGAIQAAGVATIDAVPAFDLQLMTQNVDLQQMLTAAKSKAADKVRGLLTASVKVRGRGKDFDAIKPTLMGAGAARVEQGKLVGVNVVAQALNKVDNVPGIGALLPMSVIANHPELFKSPNTDLQHASLSFTINGPRLTTSDLRVESVDYTVLGSGWFDLDQTLDMTAKILMSPAFSREMIAAKRNVSYLATENGQIEIPLQISGRLPKPAVVPDVGILARRAASHAVQGGLGKLLNKSGLGGIFGGGSGGGSSGGSSNPFKSLFH